MLSRVDLKGAWQWRWWYQNYLQTKIALTTCILNLCSQLTRQHNALNAHYVHLVHCISFFILTCFLKGNFLSKSGTLDLVADASSNSLKKQHRMICWWTPLCFSHCWCMMTSLNENISRVIGHLCGEFTGHRWIPRTKASDAELWCFLWSAPEVNNGEAGDLRRHRAHYAVTVMVSPLYPGEEREKYA